MHESKMLVKRSLNADHVEQISIVLHGLLNALNQLYNVEHSKRWEDISRHAQEATKSAVEDILTSRWLSTHRAYKIMSKSGLILAPWDGMSRREETLLLAAISIVQNMDIALSKMNDKRVDFSF